MPCVAELCCSISLICSGSSQRSRQSVKIQDGGPSSAPRSSPGRSASCESSSGVFMICSLRVISTGAVSLRISGMYSIMVMAGTGRRKLGWRRLSSGIVTSGYSSSIFSRSLPERKANPSIRRSTSGSASLCARNDVSCGFSRASNFAY